MREEIRRYVSGLFVDAPDTPEARALKEEIFSNLNDKYEDLTASGMPDKEAFKCVKAQVGDIQALIAELPHPAPASQAEQRRDEIITRKRALLSAVAVALLIISPAIGLIFSLLPVPIEFVPIAILSCVAVSVGLFVYRESAYKRFDARKRRGDSGQLTRAELEELKELRREQAQSSRSAAYLKVNWLVTICAYFIFSFTTHAWYISWIIFLIGGATAELIKINTREVAE